MSAPVRLLGWQLPNEFQRALNPLVQLFIVYDALGLYQHPALHRLASDVEFLDVRFEHRMFVLVRTNAGDERVLPNPDEHVAVEKKADPAEHLLALDILVTGEVLADTSGESLIICHDPASCVS